MKSIKICGKDFDIYCNTKAIKEIESNCVSISKLSEWLGGDEPEEIKISENIGKFAVLVTILLNGAVFKHNSEIALGMIDGEKKKFFNVDDIENLLSPSEISEYKEIIFTEIGRALGVSEVPEETEVDPDLAECASEKNE